MVQGHDHTDDAFFHVLSLSRSLQNSVRFRILPLF